MITIVYSTHKSSDYNDKFKQHLLQTVGLNDVQILEYVNHNQYSLSEVYNSGITESIYDVICCIHNDIKLEKGWGKKLLSDFLDNPEFGIIGKAGSCYFPESGVYWERLPQTMVGQVYHHPDGQKKFLSRYSPKLPFLIPVVTIDGLFISFNKTKIKYNFDETIGKFHFYDHLFCLPNYLDNVKIGVTSSFEITHQSVGRPNDEFFLSKSKFLEKWGHKLPLDLKPENVYAPEINRKKFSKFGKIAIIIPTKGKLNLLFDCINSFLENCDVNVFDIFIADTGSNNEEKNEIRSFIKDHNNINLIEFDYYNFAKINNEVVKNHIGNEYEFLLFSNNDIKILNDVISGMLDIFNTNVKCGTVGCRLHFEDNTIQHDGISMALSKSRGTIHLGHLNIRNYYNYSNNTIEVIGSTGGLLMIKKNIFEKNGYFNEDYISCFEDVHLNIDVMSSGLKNYLCGKCVAYHYESKTRDEDTEKSLKLKTDYSNTLFPHIKNKLEKIKSKITLIN
jgi:GT2 family glycosyltransferase